MVTIFRRVPLTGAGIPDEKNHGSEQEESGSEEVQDVGTRRIVPHRANDARLNETPLGASNQIVLIALALFAATIFFAIALVVRIETRLSLCSSCQPTQQH